MRQREKTEGCRQASALHALVFLLNLSGWPGSPVSQIRCGIESDEGSSLAATFTMPAADFVVFCNLVDEM